MQKSSSKLPVRGLAKIEMEDKKVWKKGANFFSESPFFQGDSKWKTAEPKKKAIGSVPTDIFPTDTLPKDIFPKDISRQTRIPGDSKLQMKNSWIRQNYAHQKRQVSEEFFGNGQLEITNSHIYCVQRSEGQSPYKLIFDRFKTNLSDKCTVDSRSRALFKSGRSLTHSMDKIDLESTHCIVK